MDGNLAWRWANGERESGQVRQYLKSTGSAAAAAACAILLSVGGLVLRWWMLRKQMGRVKADRVKVERVWQALVSDAQARSVMQQAEVLSATLARSSVELFATRALRRSPAWTGRLPSIVWISFTSRLPWLRPCLLPRCESGQRARRAACLCGAELPLGLGGMLMDHDDDWCEGTSLTLTGHPCLILSKRRTTRSRSTTGILLGW